MVQKANRGWERALYGRPNYAHTIAVEASYILRITKGGTTMEAKPENKQKVIIYCRVSSRKQVKEGNGLDSQEQACRAWARDRGYEVERVFVEQGISGTRTDRPAFSEMRLFLSRNRNEYIILAYDINRFARNSAMYGVFRQDMRKLGHTVQTVTMRLDESSESTLLETVSAAVAQYDQEKNAARTLANMREHAKQGYWVPNSPVGYKMKRIDGRVHRVRNEPTATFLQEALEGFATGRLPTQTAVKKFLERAIIIGATGKPIPITLNFVKKLLNNEKYTGWFAYPKWGIPYQQWKIEPIISIETYQAIQDRLYGRKGRTRPRKYNMVDEDFPLRRWVLCPECGHAMTADRPRSKSGKRHMYYHCYRKGCALRGKSIPQAVMHADLEDLLGQITPDPIMLNLTRSLVVDCYNELHADKRAQQQASQAAITAMQAEKDKAFNLLMNSANNPEIANMCTERISALTEQINRMQAEISDAVAEEMPLEYALDFVCEFVTRPLEIWRAGDYCQKQGVLNLCFSEKIAYDKAEKFRTPKLSPIFAVFNDNLEETNNWRALVDDFRTNYAREIQKMQAANWNWCLPAAA